MFHLEGFLCQFFRRGNAIFVITSVLILTQIASEKIDVRGCEFAPNCYSRNRFPCRLPHKTCGPCFEGFQNSNVSEEAHSNIPCVSNLEVPTKIEVSVIDLKEFREGGDADQTIKQIRTGMQETGFLILTNHGIEHAVIDKLFQISEQFFHLSNKQKSSSYPWILEKNIGYVSLGQEYLAENIDNWEKGETDNGDQKEAFDWDPSYDFVSPGQEFWIQNSKILIEYWEKINELKLLVLEAIALSLNLPRNSFSSHHIENWNTLRLLHYPPINNETQNLPGCGEHSDYGSITLLLQDDKGGLEILNRINQNWIAVDPVPYSIVVNSGDLLMQWSNNIIPSTLHRVKSGSFHRYSSAFFANPDPDYVIDPKTFFPNENPLYQPISSETYLHNRLSATYAFPKELSTSKNDDNKTEL